MRGPIRRPVVIAAIAFVAVVLAALWPRGAPPGPQAGGGVTAQATPTPSPSATTAPTATAMPSPVLAHFVGGGIGFDYPAEWGASHETVLMTMGSTFGELRPPGGARVVVGTSASPMANFLEFEPEGGWTRWVDGLPAVLTVTHPISANPAAQSWAFLFAMPGAIDNWYAIYADLRGGLGVEKVRTQLDALTLTIHYDRSIERLPSGPAADAFAADLARRAVVELQRRGWPPDQCYPIEPGTSRRDVISLPGGVQGLPVTCSTAIEPTDLQLWRLTLTIAWDAGPGYPEGRRVTTSWFAPDRTEDGTTSRGDELPIP